MTRNYRWPSSGPSERPELLGTLAKKARPPEHISDFECTDMLDRSPAAVIQRSLLDENLLVSTSRRCSQLESTSSSSPVAGRPPCWGVRTHSEKAFSKRKKRQVLALASYELWIGRKKNSMRPSFSGKGG